MTLLALLLVAAAALAVWGARRAGTAREYFAAGHRAGPWLAGLAGTAAAVSGFTFVGGPGLFAVAGAGSLWIILSAPVTGALQCWVLGERLVTDEKERALTIPELLGRRLDSRLVTGAASVVVLVGCVASLAVQVRAAAVLGESFLGLDGWIAATLVMAATTAYTAAGGMRAGLLADATQGAAMAAIGVVLAVAAIHLAGGPVVAVQTLAARRPELVGSFGSFPAGRAASLYLLFALGTLAQPHYVQKFLLVRRHADLRRLPAVLTGALAAMLAVWLGVGLGGAALVAQGRIAIGRADELAPQVMTALGPWAVLLAATAVLAAMMSTAASFLNLAAAALVRDLPRALGREPRGLGAARFATVGVGLAATLVGVVSERAVALLGVAGWGFFTAALLPAMTIGLAWPVARRQAVAAAMITGAVVDLALEATRSSLPAALEPGLAGAALGMLVLVLGSVTTTGGRHAAPDTPR